MLLLFQRTDSASRKHGYQSVYLIVADGYQQPQRRLALFFLRAGESLSQPFRAFHVHKLYPVGLEAGAAKLVYRHLPDEPSVLYHSYPVAGLLHLVEDVR